MDDIVKQARDHAAKLARTLLYTSAGETSDLPEDIPALLRSLAANLFAARQAVLTQGLELARQTAPVTDEQLAELDVQSWALKHGRVQVDEAPATDAERAELVKRLKEHVEYSKGLGSFHPKITTEAAAMLEADARWRADVTRKIEALKSSRFYWHNGLVCGVVDEVLDILAGPAKRDVGKNIAGRPDGEER